MNPVELRARREALGLSQEKMAEVLGVSQMAVSRWEAGARAPRDPVGLHMQICALEDAIMDCESILIERVTDGDVEDTQILVYTDRAAYRVGEPEISACLPLECHRVAAARAAMVLREEGYDVTLVLG